MKKETKGSKWLYAIVAIVILLLTGGNQVAESLGTDNEQEIIQSVDENAENQNVESNQINSESQGIDANSSTNQSQTDNKNENQQDLNADIKNEYVFRNNRLLEEHYEKHGIEMGFKDAKAYLAAANKVLANPNVLHKIEQEDGDDVYYLEATNEFVVVSTDGYLRTYFYPEDGIEYFNRQ